jgi:excisionase family DNA binding protein
VQSWGGPKVAPKLWEVAQMTERIAYRVDEAAKALGVSPRTMKQWVADGTIKSTKIAGVRLIDAESVKALFDKPVVRDDSAGDAAPKKSAPREAQ